MTIAVSVCLLLLFAAAAALCCGREVAVRSQHLSAGGEETGQALPPKAEKVDRFSALLCGGICLVGGGGLLLLQLLFYQRPLLYSLQMLFCFDYLAVAALVDKKFQVIPNSLVLGGCVGAAGFFAAQVLMSAPPVPLLKELLLGLAMGGGVFLICALLTKGGIGMGDVKLFGVLGMVLGWTGVFDLIFLSVLLVAVYGIVLLLRRQLNRKSQVPIGPFAFAGMILMMLLGV